MFTHLTLNSIIMQCSFTQKNMYKHLLFYLLSLLLLSCKEIKVDSKEIQKSKIKDLTELIPPIKTNSKNIEIVFCLDATGSMNGLIGTAKEKIWDIVSDLAQNNDVDTL